MKAELAIISITSDQLLGKRGMWQAILQDSQKINRWHLESWPIVKTMLQLWVFLFVKYELFLLW